MDQATVQNRSVQKKGCHCSVKCAACGVFWMALVSVGLAVLAPLFLQQLIDAGIKEGDVIDSVKADGYKHFVNYTYESKNRFIVTFFNISNARQVLAAPNVKPALEEIGPFVYNYNRNRTNLEFGEEGDTLSFNQHAWLEFNAEETSAKTNGKYKSDTDVKITTINILLGGMRIQTGLTYWHLLADLIWKDDYGRLFEHRSPHELLQGYDVEVPYKVPGLPPVKVNFPGLFPNLPLAKDPDMTHRTKIRTGKSSLKRTFDYVSWRDQTEVKVNCPYAMMHLPFDEQCKANPFPCCGQKEPVYVWDTHRAPGEFDENANAIQGCSGDQFRPGLHADKEQVLVFFDIAQRVMALTTTPGEGTYDYNGVHLRKFRPDRKLVWGNVTERSHNSRYYQLGPGGLMNLTMLFGADVFISLPHFLEADPRLVEQIDGLEPSKDKHDLYIGVEPYTGITIVEEQRAMISVQVNSVAAEFGKGKGWFPNLGDRDLFVPVAWFNQQALATSDGTDQVKTMYMAMSLITIVRWVGVGLGGLTVICAIAVGLRARKQKTAPGANHEGAADQRVQPRTGSEGLLEAGHSTQ